MVDFISGVLYRIKLKTGKMDVVAEGFGGADGVARDHQNVIWVSDWKNGRVFSLRPDGSIKLIKDGYQSAAEFNFQHDQPDWKINLEKNYYIKFANPSRYGRLHLETSIDMAGARLTYSINPDGSRNLEPK